MVPSLFGKIMFNRVFDFLWAELINMKFAFFGLIELSFLTSHQLFPSFISSFMVVSSYFGCRDEGKTLQVSSANSRKESLSNELM